MTVALSLGSYLEFLSKEYLGDFIRDGGASVKFLVSPDPTARTRFGSTPIPTWPTN